MSLRELCIEADVKMYACQMTVDVFGFSHDEFIDGLDYVGATYFLPMAKDSPELADLILGGGTQDPLQIHRREIAALFLDLRGFTAFADRTEPEEVIEVLNEYHGAIGELIGEYGGTLERFTGDGIMVFFNDPIPVPNPLERAIRLGLSMRDRVGVLAQRWDRRGANRAGCRAVGSLVIGTGSRSGRGARVDRS